MNLGFLSVCPWYDMVWKGCCVVLCCFGGLLSLCSRERELCPGLLARFVKVDTGTGTV